MFPWVVAPLRPSNHKPKQTHSSPPLLAKGLIIESRQAAAQIAGATILGHSGVFMSGVHTWEERGHALRVTAYVPVSAS